MHGLTMTVTMTVARRLGVGGLIAVAAVHANWARGSSWPAPDTRTLARAVMPDGPLPGAGPCLAVSALLTLAAAFVAGYPQQRPRLQGAGVTGVVAALSLRGVIGAVGLMTNARTSPAFTRWNRRLYSPLCLVLATLCAAGLASPHDEPLSA